MAIRSSYYDVTFVEFNSKKIRKEKLFDRQDILQFFSGVSKDYKYDCKYVKDIKGVFTWRRGRPSW